MANNCDISVKVDQPTHRVSVETESTKIVGHTVQQPRVSAVDGSQLQVGISNGIPSVYAPVIGIQGLPGTGQEIIQRQYTAGEDLPDRIIVYQDDDLKIYPADSSNLTHMNRVVGITTHSVTEDNLVMVQFAGLNTYGGWAWTEGTSLFLDNTMLQDNLIESDPDLPEHAYVLFFADAISPTTIRIAIREPMCLV